MKPGEVKLCGTTSPADLDAAIRAGADAIGIICPPRTGARHSVAVAQAARLARAVPDGVRTVLIPRFTEPAAIIALAETVRPDRLQLGETEDSSVLEAVVNAAVVPEVAQVVHVGDRSAIGRATEFAAVADIVHLDSVGNQPGGTGRTHDWSISREIADAVHALGKRVILAGGLTSDNVARAIAAVRPDGVDVETGIKGDGLAHDPDKARQFVTAARAAFGEEPRTAHP